MKRPHRLCLWLGAAWLAGGAGCASRTELWRPGGEVVVAGHGAVKLRVPGGWVHRTDRQGNFFATRDGAALQHLRLERNTLLTPRSARDTAGDLVAVLRAEAAFAGFSLCEQTPATVAGHPGFRLVFTFRDADGLPRVEARYGCVVGRELVQLCYQAPARAYFEHDLADFEAAARSLQLSGDAP